MKAKSQGGMGWPEERIKEELAICGAATPEPWVANRLCTDDGGLTPAVVVCGGPDGEMIVDCAPLAKEGAMRLEQEAANTTFIASARTNYPSALRELLVLQQALHLATSHLCPPLDARVMGDPCPMDKCSECLTTWAMEQARKDRVIAALLETLTSWASDIDGMCPDCEYGDDCCPDDDLCESGGEDKTASHWLRWAESEADKDCNKEDK